MNDPLEKLKELTPQLPELPVTLRNGKIIEYETEGGTILGFGLYKTARIAAQRAFMSAGTVLPSHCHGETEHLIIESGSLQIELNGDAHTVGTAGSITFTPGAPRGPLRVWVQAKAAVMLHRTVRAVSAAIRVLFMAGTSWVGACDVPCSATCILPRTSRRQV